MSLRWNVAGVLGLGLLAIQPGIGSPPGDAYLFEPIVTDVGRYPADAIVADLNGDGTPDAAIADGPFNNVSILIGAGDSTFAVAAQYPVGGNVLAAGDVTGDNKVDLIDLQGAGRLALLVGNGDGSFQAPLLLSTGTSPSALVVGDFTNDGVADVLVANDGSGDLSFFRSAGGTLQPEVRIPVGTRPIAIAAGDVNGDGALDAAVLLKTPRQVAVLLGNGSGMFPASSLVPLGGDPFDVVLGLLNADTRLDLAVSYPCMDQFCLTPGQVAVFTGLGDGTFQAGPTVTTGKNTTSLALADVDGDGRLDAAAATDQDVAILRGGGDGSLAIADRVLAGTTPRAVGLADLDHDGRPDLTAINGDAGAFTAIRGRGDGTFPDPAQFQTQPDAQEAVVSDVDGDGDLDLVVASAEELSTTAVEASLLVGRGDGTFEPERKIHTGGAPIAVAVADFDEDGRPDVATANGGTSGNLSIALGNGDGTFKPEMRLPAGTSPKDIAAADLDGDGHVDLVVANSLTNDVSVILGHGDGTFLPQARYEAGSGPRLVAVADLDADSIPDVVVGQGLRTLKGLGGGRLGPSVALTAPCGPLSIALGNLNADARPDLAFACNSQVYVMLAAPAGGFQPAQSIGASYGSYLAIGDFDADGVPDLVTSDAVGTLGVWTGQGNGVFAPAMRFNVAGSPASPRLPVAGDFNGDRRLDLAVPMVRDASVPAGGRVSILLNRGPFPDSDGDGLRDPDDPCTDLDGDGYGDPGFANLCADDNCPAVPNPGQADADGDAVGDACDDCPAASNPSQVDADKDGSGDACDVCPYDPLDDADGDGACADQDPCPTVPGTTSSDADFDGVGDACDDCPLTANPSQADGDADGTGDACEAGTRETLLGVPLIDLVGFQDVADFNGGGIADLMGISATAIAVRPGLGGGLFGPDIVTPLSTNGTIFGEVGDYNADGILDIAVVDRDPAGLESGRLRMMRGRGDGGFDLIQTLSFNRLPTGVDSAELNGDANRDLAVSLSCSVSPSCSSDQSRAVLFRGVADGTMAALATLVTGTTNANIIAAGDVDGDGDGDVVVAQSNLTVELFRGAGNGTFVRQNLSTCGNGGLALADIDADGRAEVLAGCLSSPAGRLAVIRAAGATPVIAVTYDTPGFNFGTGMAAADFNGDGMVDVALPPGVVLFGDGHGGFGPASGASASAFSGLRAADLDDDGHADLVARHTSGFTATLRNLGDGRFPVMAPLFGGGAFRSIAGGDLDGDGLRDLATVFSPTSVSNSRSLVTMGSDGDTLVNGPAATLPGSSTGVGAAVARLDADAHLDVLLGTSGAGLLLYRGAGDGSFTPGGTLAAGSDARYAVIGDFNEDGAADAAFANGSGVQLVLGHGDGTFDPPATVAGSSGGVLVAAHLDDDAHLDLALSEYAGNVRILAGHGDGTFTLRSTTVIGGIPRSIVAGDFDGDGQDDLAVSTDDIVAVMYIAGDGTPAPPAPLPLGSSGPVGIAAADFDGDGRDDVVVVFTTSHAAVFYGDPSRTFPPPARFAGTFSPLQQHGDMVASDFNHDGRPDVVFGGSTGLALLLNRGAPMAPAPPQAVITGAATFECDAPGTGSVLLDGSASVSASTYEWFVDTPGGLVPAGTGPTLAVARPFGGTTFVLRVTNAVGRSDTAQATIEVVDTIPPTLVAGASPSILFPANHRLVPVQVAWTVSDVCDPAPSVTLTGATSDEPDDAPGGGDGNTTGDIQGADTETPDPLVTLRAERSAQGDGRVYRLSYAAVDGSGNAGAGDAVVSVPLHGPGPDEPLILRLEHAGPGGAVLVSWTPAGGSYDVITGVLSGFTVVNSELRLGNVEVLGAGVTGTSLLDSPARLSPAIGQVVFYLAQYHDDSGPTGYGTESAPWPRVPTSCTGGCP